MSETLDTNLESGKRPGFLTVLCILTFIGSGLGVLGGLLGVLIGSSSLAMFAPQGTIVVQIIGLLASVLCLFGAIKMWGLYKQGFIIYVLGALLSIVGSVVSALTISSVVEHTINTIEGLEGFERGDIAAEAATSLAATAAWTSVVFAVIINVLFILLYNANRKHLIK